MPVVRTFHNLRSVRRSLLARALYRRTAAGLAVSRQIEARCREVGLPPSRVRWIPGMADLPRFSPDERGEAIREEFKLGTSPVIVTVSRLAPNRGHELLLAGFRLLLGRLPEARLLLVGKGEARARLESLVHDLGLGDRVIFTGYRDRDLPAVVGAADCFALMAAGSDDSCRAALEAMAAGRPVVARRVGALPETVAHGVTGWLIDDERPESVAAALARVLADRPRARAMGLAGRRRVEEEFSPERAVAIVDEIYRVARGEDPPPRVLPGMVLRRLSGRARQRGAGAARSRGVARLPARHPGARHRSRPCRRRGAHRGLRVPRGSRPRGQMRPTCAACSRGCPASTSSMSTGARNIGSRPWRTG